MIVAFSGLALIALTIGGDLSLTALMLALAAAFSSAVGNVLVKHTGGVPILPLMVWSSLIPPFPALIVPRMGNHRDSLLQAICHASLPSIAAVFYLGSLATPVAYAVWGNLRQRYSAVVVSPFALLSPCTGVLASALIFREIFGPLRYVGMLLILGGLAIIVLPRRRVSRSIIGARQS